MLIPLRKNGQVVSFSLVDDDRTDLLNYSYQLEPNGYAKRSVTIAKHKTVGRYLHHDVLRTKLGDESIHYVCDHINRDVLDNRRCNLRMCSASQNGYNKSGVTGVSLHKQSGKYEATLTRSGKKIFLGLYRTEKIARNAYKFAKPIIANDRYADRVMRIAK